MGYSTRPGTSITDFTPDDTDTVMYLESSAGIALDTLMEQINAKWPGVDTADIEISSEKIHTSCLTYDLYDSSDYTDYIAVTKTQ